MTAKRSESSSGVPDPPGGGWVLLDTNALFLPFRTHLDLEQEIRRLVGRTRIGIPQLVLGEVDRLIDRRAEAAISARILARRFTLVPSVGHGDAGILAVARRFRATVVTADRGLRDRLRASGLPVLFPRRGHQLELLPPRASPGSPPRTSPPPRQRL